MAHRPRLLTLNCHEAWVHQLGWLDADLDIIDGLPGRYASSWDARMRPVPASARLVTLGQVLRERKRYHCIIAHSVTDLMDLKELEQPRLLVLHVSLEAKAAMEGLQAVPAEFPGQVATYLRMVGGHAVAVSAMKARSWGITDDVVHNGVDVDTYPPWTGEVASGIRVVNQVRQKRALLRWDLHEAAFHDVPVRLVGHNPDLPGVPCR